MVWVTGMSLMPCMLLKISSAVVWLIVQTNALFLILLASQAGWIDTRIIASSDMVFWAFTNKMLASLALIVILDFLDRSQHKQLEALQDRGQELQNIHLELIRAQSHKDEFIASVGHELRTPMNAILGLNPVLRDQVGDIAQDTERVDMIRESTQHLLALVNDILDFSQLQAQRMRLGVEPYALQDSFAEMAQTLNQQAGAKHLQAICSIDPLLPQWVMQDRKRFTQLIHNLLDNALKFTRQGAIELHFKRCEMGLRIEVQDTGIGMTTEQASNIFGRSEKASSNAVNLYGGTGLGLSICEKLVQLQSGQIGVSSSPDRGSLFWVELPLVSTESPYPHGEVNGLALAELGSPSVFLVVDDQAVNLMVAQGLLKKIWPTCKVHTALSGKEALNWLQKNPVDVVLMDMFMPEMDGLQATQHIRLMPSPAHSVKVIGLTASSNTNDHAQCLEAGMNDIVFKPLEQDALHACVLRCWRLPR
jgi:signal transduction histidine kinase/ActR/RegA family two-component response regulator